MFYLGAGTADVRTKLAVERLLYAQRLFRTGPAFLHAMVHREFACVEGSWLHGLRADLAWMDAVLPQCLPVGWNSDLTALIDLWQDPHCTWPSLVKRCYKLHLEQTAIIADAKALRAEVFRTLRGAGASFDHAPELLAQLEPRHSCFCRRSFDTKRGLLAHQRKAHGMFSMERIFLQGCACLHCGKFLWSTQRLQQHLAYIPSGLGYNPCFFALTSQGCEGTYAKVDVGASAQFAGLSRRDALQTEGPRFSPITSVDRRRLQLQTELATCQEQLVIPQVPDNELQIGEAIGAALEAATLKWFQTFYPQGPSVEEKMLLRDAWIDALFACPSAFESNLEPWLEKIFLLWGEHWLPDVVATFEDGVAEYDVDEIFADFAFQLERYQVLARIAHLQACLNACVPVEPTAHRAARSLQDVTKHPKINSKVHQTVDRPYAEQSSWLKQIRSMSFLDLPATGRTPKLLLPDGRLVYLVLHLFSGRRRAGDVHAQLHQFGSTCGVPILVLSADTAVSNEFGNLALGSPSWRRILQLYETGVVAATLVGSPCETFSEARFFDSSPADNGRPGPRPLRSADRLLGLEGLTLRELKQCHMGGNFFQQAALTLGFHIAHGGCYISEHPAKPRDASRPSIWTSALLSLMQQHPDVKLAHICQYLWGASVVKPTGLLHFQMPLFCRDLYSQADMHASRPSEVAIGKDPTGCYKTAKHKEYPERFCQGLAFAIVQNLARCERRHEFRTGAALPADLMHWLQGAVQASSVIHRDTWLPDFQT